MAVDVAAFLFEFLTVLRGATACSLCSGIFQEKGVHTPSRSKAVPRNTQQRLDARAAVVQEQEAKNGDDSQGKEDATIEETIAEPRSGVLWDLVADEVKRL